MQECNFDELLEHVRQVPGMDDPEKVAGAVNKAIKETVAKQTHLMLSKPTLRTQDGCHEQLLCIPGLKVCMHLSLVSSCRRIANPHWSCHVLTCADTMAHDSDPE